jgi:hypothetical protein
VVPRTCWLYRRNILTRCIPPDQREWALQLHVHRPSFNVLLTTPGQHSRVTSYLLTQVVLIVGSNSTCCDPAAILRFPPTPRELVLTVADERVKAVLAQVSECVFVFCERSPSCALSDRVHGRTGSSAASYTPVLEADVTAVIGPPPGTSPHRSLVAAPKPRGRILSLSRPLALRKAKPSNMTTQLPKTINL